MKGSKKGGATKGAGGRTWSYGKHGTDGKSAKAKAMMDYKGRKGGKK